MITVTNLTKRFGAQTVVDDVSFVVRPGSISGFLGPNGAGKSTTMRMIVGLTIATSGSSTVLGVPYRDIPNPGTEVGVLLDASAQHAGRTGREVLTLGALTMGLAESRVDTLIGLVGLSPAEAKRRVGVYSLGMRQRLGIAHALLGDPKVLILDEPANGLDPAGMRWMRDLLRTFADGGGTVLLSSHILSEVEQIADELIMIGRGKIVASGSKAQLLGGSGCIIRTIDDARMRDLALAAGHSVTPHENGLLIAADPEAVSLLAFDHGLRVRELREAGSAGLEDVFLELTAASAREGHPQGGVQ